MDLTLRAHFWGPSTVAWDHPAWRRSCESRTALTGASGGFTASGKGVPFSRSCLGSRGYGMYISHSHIFYILRLRFTGLLHQPRAQLTRHRTVETGPFVLGRLELLQLMSRYGAMLDVDKLFITRIHSIFMCSASSRQVWCEDVACTDSKRMGSQLLRPSCQNSDVVFRLWLCKANIRDSTGVMTTGSSAQQPSRPCQLHRRFTDEHGAAALRDFQSYA